MPSVMTHNFSIVPKAEIQRSSFNRSHGLKTTFDADYLIPIFLDEVLPGDSFNLNMTAFARLATPIKPIMDNMFLDSFFFFVPYRLVWEHWPNFCGEKVDPDDTTEYEEPYLMTPNYGAGGVVSGTLFDYFGIPVGALHPNNSGLKIRAEFSRGYNLIWNTWFRDQNLQDPVVVDKDEGPDTYSDYVLLKRGKRPDYFTSCLPWPQKGDDVLLPLGDSAPVKLSATTGIYQLVRNIDTHALMSGALSGEATSGQLTTSVDECVLDPNGSLYADLTTATASTINSLREAFQLQRMYERDARGGTRYIEIIKSHFGVTSDDARLQRPEYLGGGSTPINIHPIAQTNAQSATGTTTPQGNLAAFGTASATGHGFIKSFTEHGFVIGMVSVRADLTYQQGLNRMFTRETRVDHYWPALAHLGEQEVLNKEIYCDGSSNDALAFGYQERYAEYRYKPSMITGMFRSNLSAGEVSLEVWHLSQDFASLPELGADFIESNTPISRVVAVNTEPQFLFDAYFNYICARPMPTYSVPGLIDHF